MTCPSVFISYSHDSTEHKDAILGLWKLLRDQGVDCIIDQYEQSPKEGWPLWCERQVTRATFVLVFCTKTYLRRYDGVEALGTGLGATWEALTIRTELYQSQGTNTKYIPVIFRRADSTFIPEKLIPYTVYCLYEDYEALYRRLTEQPAIIKPDLGRV